MVYKIPGGSARGCLQEPGAVPRRFLYAGGNVRGGSISLFRDESGNVGKSSKYRLVTLVFHDQSDDISAHLARYAAVLD